ncbi:hypothetical protein LMG7141_02343 [Ralstonia condita]|uniref:Transposon Tn7 transposition protein TnsD C-terminal domain-containing protein n=1 Tax=Ralstonia condita TaxID=3058600 RepID=A0ABM9JDL6_9RALS|nr:hypothetical protein LMG7141_02343 [Ralstonia sp. LMG 7141]
MPACRTYPCPAQWETASSLLNAAATLTDNLDAKLLNGQCFRRCSPLVYTLPCRVSRFNVAIEHAYGGEEGVLYGHTLFNYFRHGMSVDTQARANWQLIHGVRSRTSCPRLPPFVECGNRFGLQCPECSVAAHAEFGRRVSYCFHCLPFVTRCPLHGCALDCDNECSSIERLAVVSGDASTRVNSERFSIRSYQIACCQPLDGYRAALMSRLAEQGYVSDSGRIQLVHLRRDLERCFSAGFEDVRLNALIGNKNYVDLVAHGLAREERAMHPVHLTLLDMLLDASDGQSRHVSKHKSAAPKPTTVKQVDQSTRKRFAITPTLLSEKRENWLGLCKANIGLSRTQVRHRNPALWTWLYRHDRLWLSAHQFPRVPRYSGRRPTAIPPQVELLIGRHAGPKPLDAAGRARLPSMYQTRLAYGMADYVFLLSRRQLGADARTLALPAQRAAFIQQRVFDAIGGEKGGGCVTSVSMVAREAGLREASIWKHAPRALITHFLHQSV